MATNRTETSYDIIGDIHGHNDELVALLEKLGYQKKDGVYRHSERTAIFLGDFIDRGPDQRGVLNTVMPMVRQGSALAVMGNHEFNALAFHTEDTDNPGVWLRPRTNKNIQQHQAFLFEYLGEFRKDELTDVLNWFIGLPLWLELPELRIVHACWHNEHINYLTGRVCDGNTLSEQLLQDASNKDHKAYEAVEVLLKGLEIPLPEGEAYSDKDGNQRENVRTRWWMEGEANYGDVAILPSGLPDLQRALAAHTVPTNILPGYPSEEKPVFVGHYWWQGNPEPLSQNVACLDYSVAKGGKLVAYRFDGEKHLSADNFAWID